jgi:hypothetical protein
LISTILARNEAKAKEEEEDYLDEKEKIKWNQRN